MQKHQFSTVFILILIAALAVGSYVWLQSEFPHVKEEVKGDWTHVASTDEVFGSRAEPVPSPTGGDDYDYQGELVADAGDTGSAAEGESDTDTESFVYEDSGSGYDDAAYSADSYDEADYDAYGDDEPSAGTDAGDASDDADSAGNYGDGGDSADNGTDESTGSDAADEAPIDTYAYDDAEEYAYDDGSTDSDSGSDTAAEDPVEQPSDEDLYAHYAEDAPADDTEPSGPAAAPRERQHVEPIPSPTGKAPPAADAARRWWPAANEVRRGQFALIYAGQPKGSDGIALLFSRQPAIESLNASVSVVDDNGKVVSGRWTAASGNPRMATFKAAPGKRYVVLVGERVTDSQGNPMGAKLSGPVYVR